MEKLITKFSEELEKILNENSDFQNPFECQIPLID